jgi:hypothetical protein
MIKMIKLINILREITVYKPFRKLKAFQNPSGVIYLIFNGKGKNSTLEKYNVSIGWLNKKTNKIKFDKQDHTIDDFKKRLNKLNIPWEKYLINGDDYNVISIDKNDFDIKPIDKYDLQDEDVEKENWFNTVYI